MPTTKNSPLPPIPPTSSKGGLFKRLTTKLQRPHAPAPPQRAFTVPSNPIPLAAAETSTSRRKTTLKLPALPKPQAPRPTRRNEFTSAEHREAALRARGLVPARYRDKAGFTLPLSEQETQMDQRFSVLVQEPLLEESDGETEAKRIREAWLQKNTDNDVGEGGSDDEGSVRGEDDAGFGKPLTPMKPRSVNQSPVAPSSPSQAAYGDASRKRSSEQPALDPTAIPLPASPLSPRSLASTRGSETQGKVSEWLRRTPTASPTKASSSRSEKERRLDENDDFLPTPTSASLSTTRRKEKPSPISTRGSDADSTMSPLSAPSPAISPIPISPPLDFEDPRSPRNLSVPLVAVSLATSTSPERGRSAMAMAQSSSFCSTVPALSPTRTLSSSASESPSTPTTEFGVLGHARRSSAASRTSQSSEGATPRASIAKSQGEGTTLLTSAVAAVILESPAEEDAKVEVIATTRPSDRFLGTTPQVKPRRSGLFARRAELGPPPAKSAHTVASMSNLRRSVAGTISSKLHLRPKSALIIDSTVTDRDSDTEGALSPTSRATLSSTSSRSGVAYSSTLPIPRSRQPLSPTMHDRGSILLQAHAIEDEESRRLSELAFLDY